MKTTPIYKKFSILYMTSNFKSNWLNSGGAIGSAAGSTIGGAAGGSDSGSDSLKNPLIQSFSLVSSFICHVFSSRD